MKHVITMKPLSGTGVEGQYEIECTCSWKTTATDEKIARVIEGRHKLLWVK